MSILSYVAAVGLSRAGLSRAGLVRPPARRDLKRILIGLAVVAGLGLGARAGYDYWTVGRFQQ